MTTTMRRTAVTATTTGVLALGLLLAGCTSGGAGGGDDAGSGGSSAGSDGSGSTASGEGTFDDLASCDDVGSALGGVVDGLEPNANNVFQDDQASCAWLTPGVDASNIADASGILVVAQRNELSDSEMRSQIADAEAAEGVETIDDSRISAFGGQAFSQTVTQQGITASATTIISPHGLVVVTATGAGDAAPLSTDETLDAAYGLFD
ncbi:hypothetical protein [Frigoribacterium sp. MCBA15_019]|uniref:hypothetical protein n=1 Tax=Frigoribacterium sp. MCBA15_019 TaxID=1898745 RepID=UPI0008DD68A7|nr:hypothetical protein [Frigoribacterium sp. MCBA15_019]OII23810.1 hypothetical protein BIV04_06985 [Frigoribacterium sp. MCBA15_019]